MPTLTERPLDNQTLASVKNAVRDASRLFEPAHLASPESTVAAVHVMVQLVRKNAALPAGLTRENAPLLLGSLWGEQFVRQFAWVWVMLVDPTRKLGIPAVVPPDRALAIFPIYFVGVCLQNPTLDCTVAIAFDLLLKRKVGRLKPRQYLNFMDGVKRV